MRTLSHDNSYMGIRAAQPDTPKSITRNLRNLPVAAPIRAKYLYCNMMYTVATHLVEVKSQQSFSEFLDERLFQPLGMQSTCLQPEGARAKGLGERIATGYHWDEETEMYHGFQSPDCPESQGAGSIISSVNDFIKWVKALMNREDPINEKVYQGLIRMRSFPNPSARRLKPYTSPAVYAVGVEIHYYRGHMVVGHDGVIAGFGSRFFFLPDSKFGAVITGNSGGAGAVGKILVRDLIDEVLNVPEAERSYRRKIQMAQHTANDDFTAQLKIPSQDQSKWQRKERKQNLQKENKKDQQPDRLREKKSEPQKTPLSAYIGQYWHPGYHTMTVQINEDQLFIDATDRSMGFTLTFEHVGEQTRCIAHLSDFWEGGDDPMQAQFVFGDDGVVKLGLQLEVALREMIWFEKLAPNVS
jgi:hypothetical protein